MRGLRNFVGTSQERLRHAGTEIHRRSWDRIRSGCRRAGGTRFDRLRSVRSIIELNWRYKAISATGESFDKTRTRGRISKHVPDLVHRRVQAMVKINESTLGPKTLPNLSSGDELSRLLQQHEQNIERLAR